MLNRSLALGFVFFEDVNARFRGDCGVAIPVCLEIVGRGEDFAIAKVKLRCSEVCAKLLCNFYAPSEVKFAYHFAVRRNFTIEDNFTYGVNFTCPIGQT